MAEIPLLCIFKPFQPMISLPLLSLLVLAHVVRDTHAGNAQHDDLSAEIDAVTDGIPRAVTDEVSPTRLGQPSTYRSSRLALRGKNAS